MHTLFPFGFPFPTAFYLTLYVATFVIHVVFMNYVLAGSVYLAVGSIRGNRSVPSPLDAVLREWLPFMLSGAITAGIAPLLFLQILYRDEHYTANLLLSHRWMAILPVLIVGFYLLYLLKSHRIKTWGLPARAAVGLGACACFLFTAWSWSENHMLSLQRSEWAVQYASPDWFYHNWSTLPRLMLWTAGAFPTMAVVLGWQLWYAGRGTAQGVIPGTRRTALLAVGGLAVGIACSLLLWKTLPATAARMITGSLARPYLILAGIGILIQVLAWWRQYAACRFSVPWLIAVSTGTLLTITGIAVVRESVRLGLIGAKLSFSRHAQAFEVGGFGAFLASAALVAVLVLVSLRTVQTGGLSSQER